MTIQIPGRMRPYPLDGALLFFDRDTGDLWIGDVGQNLVEEVDRLAATDGAGRGANLGWDLYEGDQRFKDPNPAPGDASAGPFVTPVLTYTHDDGCSITGGVVVRDPKLPELDGAYLQVPGSGIADILYHSQLWVFFAGIIPSDATVGDAAALKGVATLLIDPAENSYVLDRLRDGGPPLFVQYGVGDGVVPNPMTERLATLAGLPSGDGKVEQVGTRITVTVRWDNSRSGDATQWASFLMTTDF